MYQMANGFWQRLYGIGAMGVSAMYDPINVGLLFSPDPFTKVGFLGNEINRVILILSVEKKILGSNGFS